MLFGTQWLYYTGHINTLCGQYAKCFRLKQVVYIETIVLRAMK